MVVSNVGKSSLVAINNQISEQFLASETSTMITWDQVTPPLVEEVGGKAYNLHKLGTIKDISVPPWFVVPASLFKQHLTEQSVFSLIEELDILCQNSEKNEAIIPITAEKIRNAIFQGEINPNTSKEILQTYKTKLGVKVAVRSSGIIEDTSTSSCAGLYDSVLNLQGEKAVIEGIKEVWASSFNLRIIYERIRLGLSQHQCMMGVVVQELIDAQASGVASTIVLGNNYPGTQITANFGMGVSVVDGEVSPDSWVLHHSRGYILEAFCGNKTELVSLQGDHGLITLPVDENMRKTYCLSEHEVQEIRRRVADIKKIDGCEIDVEFALDTGRRLFILQTRPLVIIQSETQVVDRNELHGQEPIARGDFSLPGVASGNLVYVPNLEALASGKIKLSKGDIVIAHVTTNTWSQHLANIGGLITCAGSPSSHPILLCREKGIPCVIGMEESLFKKVLDYHGQSVTLDGHNQLIYPGILVIKKAEFEDLMGRFKPIQVRPWPNLDQALPPMIHNKMIIVHEGKYWRKTPTFPIVGFQAEFNLRRFDLIGELVSKPQVIIEARQIDGFVCFLFTSYEEHVSLFNDMTLAGAKQFHLSQKKCMQEYLDVSSQFALDPVIWRKYIELSAQLRAYILLGGALRSYAERQVDQMGVQLELPHFYLDKCAHVLQSEMTELDTEMHQDIHNLAIEMKACQPVENVMELKDSEPSLFHKIEILATKYRFEHQISLHIPTDLNVAYKRLLTEIEYIQSGHVFTTHKGEYKDHTLLPHTELREWLRISIENRLLQSDAHHLDARSKTFVRPKMLELGEKLVAKGILSNSNQIFDASVEQIAGYCEFI
jgi:phosphohistidine swiveling domain-containing protein